MSDGRATRVVVIGGGYAGLMAARTLLRDRRGVEVTVIDPSPYMTYQPLLPEVAGGHVAPADVALDLRQGLRGCRVLQGAMSAMDSAAQTVSVHMADGEDVALHYDHAVLAVGSITRVFPTPGLEEHGIGFKTIEEAAFLHDHVIDQVALAAATADAEQRMRALTFVFVGGGYTGVEALAELEKLSRFACRRHPEIDETDLRWVLVEALDRVAPEVGPVLSRWTLAHLRRTGVDVRLKTTVSSCGDGFIDLDDGRRLPTNTLVWTAGVQPNPILERTDLPRGEKGHVVADVSLRVVREDGSPVTGVWAVGDNAQIPDLTAEKQPAYYPPNAQNAMRQGPVAARNILATLDDRPLEQYRHASLGTVASYGIGSGAANIKGIRLKGLPAWLVHRGYHLLALPSMRNRLRVLSGWILEPIAGVELTSMKAIRHPKRPFRRSFAFLRDKSSRKTPAGSQ